MGLIYTYMLTMKYR